MKKTRNPMRYALAVSLLGSFFPTQSHLNESHLEAKVLNCSQETQASFIPKNNTKRNYSEDEILKTIHSVYECLPSKPEYLSEKFIKEMVKMESSYDNLAIGRHEERGLLQILPETWKEQTELLYRRILPFDSAFNPRINLQVGISYLFWIEEFSRNNYPNWETLSDKEKRRILMASYNGGIGNLLENNGDVSRMPLGTRNYINAIESGIED